MIIGSGVDIVEVERIKRVVERWGDRFLRKVFTDREIEFANKRKCVFQHLAARFAAKEAVIKAFANGVHIGVSWKDIEVTNDKGGKPSITLYGLYHRFMWEWNIGEVIVSMSHTKDYALSTVLLVGNARSDFGPSGGNSST